MTDRGFKLTVRAIGLVVVLWSLPSLATSLFSGFSRIMSGDTFIAPWDHLFTILGPACQVGFGCYLMFGARGLIYRFIREARDHCLCCGYNIKGLTTGRCPECGEVFESRHAEAPPPPVDPPAKIDP